MNKNLSKNIQLILDSLLNYVLALNILTVEVILRNICPLLEFKKVYLVIKLFGNFETLTTKKLETIDYFLKQICCINNSLKTKGTLRNCL